MTDFARREDPTPEEIRQRRDAIKAAWDSETREKRRVIKLVHWLPPTIDHKVLGIEGLPER